MDYIDVINRRVTVIIFAICLISLILCAIIIFRSVKRRPSPQFLIDSILILGLASFSYPVFRLIYGLYVTAETVNEGGEMSVSLAWKGIGNVLPSITIGLIALHISVICWFIVRRFSTKKNS